MLFAVHMLDKTNGGPLRGRTSEAHRAFVREHAHRIFLGGPLLAEDGITMIGSLIIIECSDRGEAEAFIRAEPYQRAGLFESVVIRAFEAVITPQERPQIQGRRIADD